MTTAALSIAPQLESLDSLAADLVARQSRSRDESMSVDDQIAMMTKWCDDNGITVNETHIERDVSGRKPLAQRKGLKVAVTNVEEGRANMIVTAYFDRFVRSVVTRAEVVQRVERAGGSVMTLDMGKTTNATAVDKLSGTMLAAISEFYADQVGEKLTTAKQRLIDRGVPPFPRITPAYVRVAKGEKKGTLVPHEKNGPLIAEACRMRCDGVSFAKIRDYLAENGVDVTLSRVESMLTSKLLIGEIHFGSFTPNLNAHEPIIDRATHRKLCSMRATRGRYSKSERLLARQSVLVCANCKTKMTVTSSRASTSKTYTYYRCGNRCAQPARIRCEVIEDAVRDRAIELSKSIKGRASAKLELNAARIDFEAAQTKLATTIELLADLAAEPTTKQTLDALQIDRDEKKARHERLLARSTPSRTATSLSAWDVMTLDERRALVRSVIARVRVSADGSFVIDAHLLT